MKLLLKGGRIVDPANGIDGTRDLLIVDGVIAKVGADLPVEGAASLKAAVIPVVLHYSTADPLG